MLRGVMLRGGEVGGRGGDAEVRMRGQEEVTRSYKKLQVRGRIGAEGGEGQRIRAPGAG